MTPTHEQILNDYRDRLAEAGISAAEYSVLNVIHYGCHMSAHRLGAFCTSPDYALGVTLTDQQGDEAVQSCFDRGWIRVMTKSQLQAIKRIFKHDVMIGPVYGWPRAGSADFTEMGAKVWQAIKERWTGIPTFPQRGFAYTDVVEERTRRVFLSRAGAERQRSLIAQSSQPHAVSKITRHRDFRLAWWLPPGDAWEFESTEVFKWQGHSCDNSGPFLRWNRFQCELDLRSLRKSCAITGREFCDWCVLLAFASSSFVSSGKAKKLVTQFALRDFRMRNAEARMVDALRRCADQKLVVRCGPKTTQHVEDSLKSGARPFVMPDLSADCLTLSPEGIEMLRNQGSTVFGEAWLDGWQAEQVVFCRSHHYAARKLDIASIFQDEDQEENDRVLTVGRITPIGKWCVYWWEQFPNGYCVELDVELKRPPDEKPAT